MFRTSRPAGCPIKSQSRLYEKCVLHSVERNKIRWTLLGKGHRDVTSILPN